MGPRCKAAQWTQQPSHKRLENWSLCEVPKQFRHRSGYQAAQPTSCGSTGIILGLFAYLDSEPGLQPHGVISKLAGTVKPNMAENWCANFEVLSPRQGLILHRFSIDA